MDIVSVLIQIISGVVGGNAAGMSKQNMGPVLNSIFGGVGGIIVGQILAAVMGDTTVAAEGGLNISAILSSIVGGGAGGAILTFIAGLIKSKMAANK